MRRARDQEVRDGTVSGTVSWDTARTRTGGPIKLYLETASMAEIQDAKNRLEQVLENHGFHLYPRAT